MRKFSVLLASVIAVSVMFINCNKETTAPPSRESEIANKGAVKEELSGPDVNCSGEGALLLDAALRQIVFTATLPNSVLYNFNLATASDVAIFAQDCCIQDDVVEIYVDGCLVATVDSRGQTGPYSETHTVTLRAGNHQIEYRNTISGVGPSGWNVSETFSAPSNIMIDGCDTGVPNYDITCGNSMQELILACAVSAQNHGDFVSCVAHLTNAWKKAHLITGAQKDAIMQCAAESNLP